MTQGQQAELAAKAYLQRQGLHFIAQNVRYPFGEIDLVMRAGEYWVFVEVKYRARQHYGGALNALSQAQIARIRRAASHYLQLHDIDAPCRFDLIAFDADEVQWLVDAF
ncbi:YraN family protein [Shewanella salipaludis]|uniref:UPF0102 protein HC757_07925 n=1 Tax=Shewanella salipaludis TaxID=2723052 RepID=A0A972G611_9GAMM|nr:YraN family protein [Shewanella salipaludis]NMH65100.1 YraN family protein [Shewanella salipaludis]